MGQKLPKLLITKTAFIKRNVSDINEIYTLNLEKDQGLC